MRRKLLGGLEAARVATSALARMLPPSPKRSSSRSSRAAYAVTASAAAACGVAAAVVTPGFVGGGRLGSLVRPPDDRRLDRKRSDVSSLGPRVARRAVSGLGILPGPWRSTCLYRSVAECIVLRCHGVPAYVRIGAQKDVGDRRQDTHPGEIGLHAWVETTGQPPPAEAKGYLLLEPWEDASPTASRHGGSRQGPASRLIGSARRGAGRGVGSACGPHVLRETETGWALPADGRLVVACEPAVRPLVEDWVPITARELGGEGSGKGLWSAVERWGAASSPSGVPTDGASIGCAGENPPGMLLRVKEKASRSRRELPESRPTVEMESVRAWVEGDQARLEGRLACGDVDLASKEAEIRVSSAPFSEELSTEVFWLLSLGAALLLGRGGCCLLHAGAVVDPAGGVWLVAADGGSGKSTLSANLLREGWRCLSDDHIVVSWDGREAVNVEGWLRPFGLDAGWPHHGPTGEKLRVDPTMVAPASSFPLSGRARGVLVPVAAEAAAQGEASDEGSTAGAASSGSRGAALLGGPASAQAGAARPSISTTVEPMRPAECLPILVRQAGWMVADRPSAPGALGLLDRVARLPSYRLRLGLDSFSDSRPVSSELLVRHPEMTRAAPEPPRSGEEGQ